MAAAHTPPEMDAEFVEVGEQRCADRRGKQRRAARARLDTYFAATLLNQLSEPERPSGRYTATQLRPGIVVNLRA